jgi:hypothetical protein
MARTSASLTRAVSLFVLLLLLPGLAAAQQASGIAGLVRDTSGAVLPGVTVEAASPVLIEKVRSAVTDGGGRYSIVDLRPGVYTVTFALPGFATVERAGISLPGGFTATVNVELRVGALEETVTVTGAAPLVDVQSVRQQSALSEELLEALPTSTRTWGTLTTMTPGLNYASGLTSFTGTGGVYAENNPQRTATFDRGVGFHGKIGATTEYDGMNTNAPAPTGGMGYVSNAYTAEEMRVETGAVSAESKTAGLVFNMIPKEGGNTVNALFYGHGTAAGFQSSNLTDALRRRGIQTSPEVDHTYDTAVALGGPLKLDKIWFYTAHRWTGSANRIPGLFHNATHGTPFYTPDLTRPAFTDDYFRSNALRLTWQVSQRNKLNGFVDVQENCACKTFQRGQSIESMGAFLFTPNHLFQATWSSPLTNRLLFEAGSSAMVSKWNTKMGPDVPAHFIPITDRGLGLQYNARSVTITTNPKFVQRFSTSYITGSHAFKAGFLLEQGFSFNRAGPNSEIQYFFLNGVPTAVEQRAFPLPRRENVKADLGIFVQDRWTVNRLTLNAGLRFDYFNVYVPPQHAAAGAFVPERNFDRLDDVPNWKNLNPRLGVAYDLFGNGRTAVKASLSRYNGPAGVAAVSIARDANPLSASVSVVTRTWTDTNRNYVPDCDLRNLGPNAECGPVSDQNFGGTRIRTRFADDVTRGWSARDYLWDASTEVQHQLGAGLSVTAGYYRNWYGNFRATDNLEIEPADFSPYCITAPLDPRLPGGGGYQVCGLYDVSPAKFGRVNNLITQASNFGKQSRASDFFAFVFGARFSRLQAGGGLDTGRTVTDECFVVDSPQQLLHCRDVYPFRGQTQLKMYATYQLPADIVVSGIWQNVSGPPVEADFTVPNSAIAPSLGRNLAACGTQAVCSATATVPLMPSYTAFEDRRNQVDVRLSKVVRLGRIRLQGNLDVFNLFNDAAITVRNNAYGSAWGRPQSIVEPRLLQLGGQVTF